MKFVASDFAALGLMAASIGVAHADSVAQCPAPPGGQVVCEDNQWAVCEVKDGKVKARCFTFQRPAPSPTAFQQREALARILNEPVKVRDMSTQQVKAVLATGAYQDAEKRVTFSAPAETAD